MSDWLYRLTTGSSYRPLAVLNRGDRARAVERRILRPQTDHMLDRLEAERMSPRLRVTGEEAIV